MRVVTFTRSTPDTAAKVWVDDGGKVTWGDVATVVNPWDEYSLEETIVQAQTSGDSTVIAIGGALHDDALKHSMAMGIKNALRIEASAADEQDSLVWSALAAGAINKLGGVDLIIFGKESVDVASDQPHISAGSAAGAGRCSAMSPPYSKPTRTQAQSKSKGCWNRANRS